MKTLILAVSIVSPGVLFAQAPAQSSPKETPSTRPPAIQSFEQSGWRRGRKFESLTSAHEVYTEDFASKPGFGSGRILFLPAQDGVSLAGKTYRFSTPELIGLENDPVVYRRTGGIREISVAIMSKAELRTALKRRALTSVESNAVAELRAGRNLVTHEEEVPIYTVGDLEQGTVAGIRAIGALRAGDSCAHCHGVPKGTLLGAFSYALTPTNLVAVSTPDAIRSTKPQPPRPVVNPTVAGTNSSFTLMPDFKSISGGSLTVARTR